MKKFILILFILLMSFPAFGADMKVLINTGDKVIELGGERFIPGEWLHVKSDFGVTLDKDGKVAEDLLAAYPEIKSPEAVLQDKLKAVIEERNLNQFATGIKEASTMYAKPLPALADLVLTIAPVKVSDEKAMEVK